MKRYFSNFLPLFLALAFHACGNPYQSISHAGFARARCRERRHYPVCSDSLLFVRKGIASQLVGTLDLFIRHQCRDCLDEIYLNLVLNAYQGKVVILNYEHSAFSAEEFSGSLQASGRAANVGSQTTGNRLVGAVKALLNGIALTIPGAKGQTRNGRILEYNGVEPDIAVTLDRQ